MSEVPTLNSADKTVENKETAPETKLQDSESGKDKEEFLAKEGTNWLRRAYERSWLGGFNNLAEAEKWLEADYDRVQLSRRGFGDHGLLAWKLKSRPQSEHKSDFDEVDVVIHKHKGIDFESFFLIFRE